MGQSLRFWGDSNIPNARLRVRLDRHGFGEYGGRGEHFCDIGYLQFVNGHVDESLVVQRNIRVSCSLSDKRRHYGRKVALNI